MIKFLKRFGVGLGALALVVLAGANNALAATYDYSSSTGIVNDSTSGLGSTLYSGIAIVVGLSLGIWAIFLIIGRLKKHVK